MKSTRRLWNWTAMLLTSTSLIVSAGCKTRIIALPSDKTVVPMPAGKAYTPALPGFFVPQSRMQEILTELNNCK